MQTAVTEALEAWRRDGAARQPGRLAADRRAAQRPRPGPPPHPPGRAARRTARPRGGAVRRRARRTDDRLGAALRLLPPGARPRGAAGAHPAGRGRHDDAADRAGVPGQRAHARPADRAGQAQDRHRRDRPDRARRRRADRAARRRAGGDRADVQRGLRVLRRRAPRTATSPATPSGWPAWSPPACRGEAEAWGLAALLDVPARARRRALLRRRATWCCCPTRTGRAGTAPPIAAGEEMLERAAALHSPGPFQLRAAIAACHATSPSWAETDWLQIVTLFEVLTRYDPSPVVRLNRAVAMSQIGPAARSRRRWPPSTSSPTGSTATTSSTPPAPSCSPGSAATTRPTRPTRAPWPSPATTPNAACSPPACTAARSTTGRSAPTVT